MTYWSQFYCHSGCALKHAAKAVYALACCPRAMATLTAIALAVVLLFSSGCASAGSKRWYSPATWFSARPATAADKAHAVEAKAQTAATDAEDKAMRAAHVEIAKADVSNQSLPPSRATDLSRRFVANGLGLLDQVQPLTAAESAELRVVVAGLLSESAETVAAAEKKQAAAETEASRLSRELSQARTEANAATLRADQADAKLRTAFDRENALANDLRAQKARFWIAIGALVLVSGFALYAKLALGGVGAALHAAGAPAGVIQALDSRLSTFGQYLVRVGRQAEAKSEAVKQTIT